MKIMKKKSVTITLDQMADFLLVLSIFLFAYRGNLGGIIAIISLIVRILKGKFVKTNANKVLLFWILYLLVFPICIYIISNKNFEFYAFMGYILSLSILIFANELDYERIFKYIYVGAIFIAASVLLQFLLPGIFDSIAKIIMPSNVYISVINRNSTGYVTGLTREVSYAALFLFIGLLYSIFIKKNSVISFVWLGILFLTGKKAQPIFAIIAICIVLYSQTKNLKKHLKILCGIIAGVFAIVVSFPVWKNISFLERLVTFIENIKNGSDIIGLTSGRTVIYERAIELWSQNKWFGIGWENFRNIGAYGSSEYTTWFNHFDVHNCYLQILCETGIIGAAIFLSILIPTLIYAIKILRNNPTQYIKFSEAYFIFFWIFVLTEPCLYTDSYVIFLALALAYIFKRHKAE